MAWVMVDDITGERIEADDDNGATTLAFDGEAYELHLSASTRADIWEQLRVVLCRARPLDGAPAIAAPDECDPPAGTEDDEQGGAKAAGDDPAEDLDAQREEARGTYGPDDIPLAVQLDRLTGEQGPAVPQREPDWRTRAEELLEQHWTPARVSRELNVEVAEVRDLLPGRRAGAR